MLFHLTMRKKPRTGQNPQNFDLLRKLGNMTIPTFDGSDRCTARAWVHKLDTYFQLNPMTEAKMIKFSTLHLDGEAHEWWYHELLTLGHSNITSYEDFTQRPMDRFDRKDPEIHFRELAQLRQTSTPEAYVTEFQQMAVIMTDVSEHRLVMLFTEGLAKPLRCRVNDFRPNTLQEAIMKTRDMADTIPKKTSAKTFFPQKGWVSKRPQKTWTGKDRLDEET
jgi:hypothetical protein